MKEVCWWYKLTAHTPHSQQNSHPLDLPPKSVGALRAPLPPGHCAKRVVTTPGPGTPYTRPTSMVHGQTIGVHTEDT